MTKPVATSPRASLAQWRARRASWLAFVALCSVLLQLCSALHFSLVSHRFNADLGSFVHEHVRLGSRVVSAPRAPSEQPVLARGAAACTPDVCPVGFAGPVSALLAAADLTQLISLPAVTAPLRARHVVVNRARCLLNAPKHLRPLGPEPFRVPAGAASVVELVRAFVALREPLPTTVNDLSCAREPACAHSS